MQCKGSELMYLSHKLSKGLVVILLLSPSLLASSNPFEVFPEGKGRNLVISRCIRCHSPQLVVANRMSRKLWDKTITWMQEKQGLEDLDKKTREGILDYLEEFLSPPERSSMDPGMGPRNINPLPS